MKQNNRADLRDIGRDIAPSEIVRKRITVHPLPQAAARQRVMLGIGSGSPARSAPGSSLRRQLVLFNPTPVIQH